VFVFYDDVQYDHNGWRNRNRIKTSNGPVWITVPVSKKGSMSDGRTIMEIEIDFSRPWQRKQLATIRQAYARAPHLERYGALVEGFLRDPPERLVDLTIPSTIALAHELGFDTKFVRSSELGVTGAKTDRLLAVLAEVGATEYLSGPAARAYLEEDKFERAGIELEYMAYEYPEYPQLHPPYDPQVSIIDLLFTVGPDAASYFEAPA
jgi:hypothetical protein